MARCEKCLQYGLPALCENADEGPDQRICHTGRSSKIILPGRIANCQIEPVLPILAKIIKHPTTLIGRRGCQITNCPWKNSAIRSWTE